MKKFIYGFVIGALLAFPMGINFGKDVPLLSNPFAAKPDIPSRIVERTGSLLQETKETIHEATKPVQEQMKK